MPIRIGMPTKKTIVVPCIVNSWLNVSGPRTSLRGHEELPAHQQRLDAADHQEDDGHQDVHDADLLVIDGGRPVVKPVGQPKSAAHSAGVPVSSRPRVGSTTDMVADDSSYRSNVQRSVSK